MASSGASLGLASRIRMLFVCCGSRVSREPDCQSGDTSAFTVLPLRLRLVIYFRYPQTRQQLFENRRNGFINTLPIRANHDLWVLRSFVRRVDASEFTDLASPRLLVEILRIPRFANFQRRINEHFDKLSVAFQRNLSRAAAMHPIRGNERRDHYSAGIRHELGHFAYAANVFHPVVWRESEIGIQSVPDVVAVEHIGMHGALKQLAFKCLSDGRFPGARKPG